jgi:23S rRNA pseudoU1915 N3-methylase RlmH
MPKPNLPAHHNTISSILDRCSRREIESMGATAILDLYGLRLRTEQAQAAMMADTALAHTASACVAGTSGFNAVLRAAAPDADQALSLIEATLGHKLARRLDDFL